MAAQQERYAINFYLLSYVLTFLCGFIVFLCADSNIITTVYLYHVMFFGTIILNIQIEIRPKLKYS